MQAIVNAGLQVTLVGQQMKDIGIVMGSQTPSFPATTPFAAKIKSPGLQTAQSEAGILQSGTPQGKHPPAHVVGKFASQVVLVGQQMKEKAPPSQVPRRPAISPAPPNTNSPSAQQVQKARPSLHAPTSPQAPDWAAAGLGKLTESTTPATALALTKKARRECSESVLTSPLFNRAANESLSERGSLTRS